MSEEENPRMEALCRFCLAHKDKIDLVKIFPQEAEARMSIPMRIMACAALEVKPSDELPKNICKDCRYQLEQAFYMRKRSQASDSKLRKHLRLRALGKKSRVFAKTFDENFEDELEFEDSMQFLKEHDEAKKQQEKENIRKLREEVVEEVRLDLRNEIRLEVYTELRGEIEQELREMLRAECTEVAKAELREEVKNECRLEEMKELLNEMEVFLSEKRGSTRVHNDNIVIISETKESEKTAVSLKDEEDTNTTRPIKRHSSSTLIRNTQHQRLNGDADEFKLKGNVVEQDNDNFYIVESEEANEEATAADSQRDLHPQNDEDGSYYDADIDGEHFHLAASEHSTSETTSYQIDMNEMRLYKKESGTACNKLEMEEANEDGDEVIVFNFEQQMDINPNYDAVDIVDLATKAIIMNNEDRSVEDTNKAAVDAVKEPDFTKHITSNSLNASDTLIALLPHRITDTVKSFKCQSCPRVFSTLASFERHMHTHQKVERKGSVSSQCPECHIFVSCRSALTRHMVIHSGTRPHKCPTCDKAFVQREILKRHLQTHTGERPHRCLHCNRTFTQKANLLQHINKNHMEEPKVRQHWCHLCPKRFNHASGLSRHLAAHNGVLFQCTKCDRTFGDRSSVKRHVQHVHGAAVAKADGTLKS